MRWLEIRRHSLTKKGDSRGRGSHLSPRGVALARRIGAGPFAYVLTSASPRAIETAIAMGHAVDDTIEMPSGYVPGEVAHHEQWSWPQPYVRYAELLGHAGGLASVVHTLRSHWTRAVEAEPDGSSALVISHGGSIEPTLVSCLPEADHGLWGSPFSHGDGVRLEYADGAFANAQWRRAPTHFD